MMSYVYRRIWRGGVDGRRKGALKELKMGGNLGEVISRPLLSAEVVKDGVLYPLVILIATLWFVYFIFPSVLVFWGSYEYHM
jgi:hypothetical protein